MLIKGPPELHRCLEFTNLRFNPNTEQSVLRLPDISYQWKEWYFIHKLIGYVYFHFNFHICKCCIPCDHNIAFVRHRGHCTLPAMCNWMKLIGPGLIVGLCLPNERRCYFVTTSPIAWAILYGGNYNNNGNRLTRLLNNWYIISQFH